MGSTTARTGKHAQAVVCGTRVARMTQWDVTDQVSESVWGDSDNGGFDVRAPARRGATGSIQGKFDSANRPTQIFKAGDCCSLVLWEDINVAQAYWYFAEVLISSFNVLYNQDSKEVVGWTANYGSSGKYYSPDETGKPSATPPTPPVT